MFAEFSRQAASGLWASNCPCRFQRMRLSGEYRDVSGGADLAPDADKDDSQPRRGELRIALND